MKSWVFWVWLLCCLPIVGGAAELTREHVLAMHNAGIRMALGKADGTSEKPYVIPLDIDPAKLLGTELLDFSGRPLVELPSWLVRFKKLRKLDLSNTGIKVDTALIAALGNMPELDVLKLNDNPLFPEKTCLMFCDPEVTLATVWPKLTALTEVNLTNTGGTAENLGSFAPLENLTHVYLGGNRIDDEVNKLGLGNPSNVRYLNLANNGISDSPLPYLPTQTLVELDLSGNDLREVPFVDMPVLERWDISNNAKLKLADGFGSMFALPHLQYLSVSDAMQAPSALAQRLQKMAADRQAAIAKAAEEKAAEEKRKADEAAKAAEEKRLAEAKAAEKAAAKAAEEERKAEEAAKAKSAELTHAEKVKALPPVLVGEKRVPRYRINGDGTVTDTETRLMWKRCSEGQSGEDCSGKAEEYTWDDAISKFGKGVSFAGYSDWRMPTLDEWGTLLECNGVIMYDPDGGGCVGTVFPNTPPISSSQTSDTFIGWIDREKGKHVRLVRSGQ